MDWYLAGDDPAGARTLRHQVRDYLARHGEPGADTADAELILQEVLANAIEHATGPVWVRLTWVGEEPDVEVWDLGPGFELPDDSGAAPVPVERREDPVTAPGPHPQRQVPDLLREGGRGLFLISHLAPAVAVAARRGGGSRVTARLPVRRAPSRSIDPAPYTFAALPDLEEAGADGGFGRESFLRALVVQLSQVVEHACGPDTGEEVVAQVGLAVGRQMEAAYRAARTLADRLTPQQLADCYVRLKHAIEGAFYVIEISDDRIVLGNSRCPFGDAVRKAPALCRMTSSVFGGIAARNRDDGAAVVLEERIAVGDPGCRVVVYLGEPPAEVARFAHRYRSGG